MNRVFRIFIFFLICLLPAACTGKTSTVSDKTDLDASSREQDRNRMSQSFAEIKSIYPQFLAASGEKRDELGVALSRLGYHPLIGSNTVYLPSGHKIRFRDRGDVQFDRFGMVTRVVAAEPFEIDVTANPAILVKTIEFSSIGGIIGFIPVAPTEISIPGGARITVESAHYNLDCVFQDAIVTKPFFISMANGTNTLIKAYSKVGLHQNGALSTIQPVSNLRVKLPSGDSAFVSEVGYYSDLSISNVVFAEPKVVILPDGHSNTMKVGPTSYRPGIVYYNNGKIARVYSGNPFAVFLPDGEQIEADYTDYYESGELKSFRIIGDKTDFKQETARIAIPGGEKTVVTSATYSETGALLSAECVSNVTVTMPDGQKIQIEIAKIPSGATRKVEFLENGRFRGAMAIKLNVRINIPVFGDVDALYLYFHENGTIDTVTFTEPKAVTASMGKEFPEGEVSGAFFDDKGRLTGLHNLELTTVAVYTLKSGEKVRAELVSYYPEGGLKSLFLFKPMQIVLPGIGKVSIYEVDYFKSGKTMSAILSEPAKITIGGTEFPVMSRIETDESGQVIGLY